MTSSPDTEITLGTGKLLFLFFFLVAICALFFAMGYSLGRRSEPGITTASAAPVPQIASSGSKPEASAQQPSMSFYKAVEQKDAGSELAASAPDARSDRTANTATSAPSQPPSSQPDPAAPSSTNGYFVQVAAVTKQDDAEALVEALKKKQYPAFVATASPGNKLFRVQLGPFIDIKDAEGVRSRLVSDGYNPILKK